MNETTTDLVIDEGFTSPSINGPEWLVELIERLKVVLAKLLYKFGIRW
ncbi:MAG: hypothetical protein NC122_07175 [Faecalibacterium sp.]|nr:hypothetical protein [Ruminococcus sp.]MCM1391535.1 hypothetical protein [Ruminococcus sp.]MCM1485973.1 hypothetical protein [Faecalibacterium sp.]